MRHPERPVRVDYFTAETLEYAESAVFLDQELFTLRPQRLRGELSELFAVREKKKRNIHRRDTEFTEIGVLIHRGSEFFSDKTDQAGFGYFYFEPVPPVVENA